MKQLEVLKQKEEDLMFTKQLMVVTKEQEDKRESERQKLFERYHGDHKNKQQILVSSLLLLIKDLETSTGRLNNL
jgi:hypothetical protein